MRTFRFNELMMQNAQHTNPITIGYLAPNIAEGNGVLLWLGILEQAKALGVRLVTFAGGELRYPEPFYHQANQVYELADRQQLDGLIIWTSSLATFIGPEGIQNFCKNFSPLPVVGIGMPIAGIPSIILESYKGMREAVEHLVQVHGKKRMAYIRGPERHYDAGERLQAYQDVVAEFGLDNNPGLITPPCRWVEQDAAQAIRMLVEEHRIQFDSIVSVNDQLAYGAMQYLQEKGFRIPEEIAIVGFDNNPIGRVCTPPLTTVPNRMRERGRRAMRMLLEKINGREIPDVVTLTTGIKVRQSCGCRDPYIVQAGKTAVELIPQTQRSNLVEMRTLVIDKLQAAVPAVENTTGWPERLLSSFETSLDTLTDIPFLTILQELLQSSVNAGLESREWQAALSELRPWFIFQNQGQFARSEFAERLLHQGRVMISEITTRSRAHQEWVGSRRLNNLHGLRQTISAAETLDGLLEILAEELPRLGIVCGCLALYPDSARPSEGARLVLAFNKNGRLPGLEGQVFRHPSHLVPPDSAEFSGIMNMMVHSLHFGPEQLGFLVVDASAFEGSSHQVLREQISSALKGVLLIEQNVQLYRQARQNQQLAEEANLLKSRFLSIVSHELLTPIVLLVGLSEMMLRVEIGDRPELPEVYRQDLTRIHASAQQLGSLVRDVLDLSRSQMGQLTLSKKPINLAEVLKPVDLVCEQMASSKGLDWQVHIPEYLPQVMGDASRLQQVVLNLVSNAVKFTTRGSVKLDVEVDAGFITVAVNDTGLSVPLSDQKAIFDEFRQSERTVARGFGGLGIGLAICRQLIEMHGGKIGVHSSGEENQGSTFYFSLPILSTPIPAGRDIPSQTVLILTERPQRSEALRLHLEEQGYETQVLDASHNPRWLEYLLASPQGALVLDFEEAKKGWEILENLKTNPDTQDLPVIFYSLLQDQDSGSMLALDYLPKPVATTHLGQILERYGIHPDGCTDPVIVLIVDDDANIRELHRRLVTEFLPTCQVQTACNGKEALAYMRASPPGLVLLDLLMPEMSGIEVLNAMQVEDNLQGIPVVVLTAQRINQEEMEVLNKSVSAVLSKGIFTSEETLIHVERALSRLPRLGSETQRLVRKVMAYIHEHFDQPIHRKELAGFAGVSERHLNRCFVQETCLTPLNYLNRYRIQQAKSLLEQNQLNITEIMGRVGFSDSSHFARVFRREVGVSPSAYKKGKRLTPVKLVSE